MASQVPTFRKDTSSRKDKNAQAALAAAVLAIGALAVAYMLYLKRDMVGPAAPLIGVGGVVIGLFILVASILSHRRHHQ